jgi:glycoprotein-N-acetylgalactosamine 3-beta-galactosyltransferase
VGNVGSSRLSTSLPILDLKNATIEKYDQLSEKTLLALSEIARHYLYEFDWFFKADDDTFVIVENLRHLLRYRSSNFSFYFGYVARTPDRFYPSGGAGYVLSRQALKQFAEEILFKPEKRQLCRTDQAEDINLAYCLARVGVFVSNARDDQQRERFHPMTFEQHFMGKFTRWIERNAQFPQEKGERCCSPLTISFHSLSPDDLRMMEFLLYHLQKASD